MKILSLAGLFVLMGLSACATATLQKPVLPNIADESMPLVVSITCYAHPTDIKTHVFGEKGNKVALVQIGNEEFAISESKHSERIFNKQGDAWTEVSKEEERAWEKKFKPLEHILERCRKAFN